MKILINCKRFNVWRQKSSRMHKSLVYLRGNERKSERKHTRRVDETKGIRTLGDSYTRFDIPGGALWAEPDGERYSDRLSLLLRALNKPCLP
jgi:hypothetical protein